MTKNINNKNALHNFMQNQNNKNSSDNSKTQNKFSAKKKRKDNEEYKDLTDEEIAEKEELIEAKKNSNYMASRYNKNQMSKMAIKDLFMRYGLVALALILLVFGLLKSAIKMFS
jgi:hypothetical protein